MALSRHVLEVLLLLSAISLPSLGKAEESRRPDSVRLNTANFPPLQTWSEGKLGGEVPRIVECVLNRMKQPYRVAVLPWIRAQKEVEEGVADGFFSAAQTPYRDAYATASDPVFSQDWYWYLRSDVKLHPSDPEFKKQVRLGGVAGTDDLKELKELGYQVITSAQSPTQLARMILSGRIDGIRLSEGVMKVAFMELGYKKIPFKSYLVASFPLRVYFGNSFLKKRPEFLKHFNQSIPACKNVHPERL